MLASVRLRLTLWHTAVLAALLVLFSIGAYTFVVRTGRARTDAAVLEAAENLAAQLALQSGEETSTAGAAREVLRELRFRTYALMVYDDSGHLLAASVPRPRLTASEDSEPPFDPARLGRLVASTRIAAPRVVTIPDSEGGYRAALTPMPMRDGHFVAGAAVSVHEEAETLAAARLAMGVAIPLALLLASLGGWLLARHSLAPVVAMREQAARIGATSLGERLPIANPEDEIGGLAAVFNALLARLERAFAQQQQFMTDASHELRTPVAVVQHEASLALSRHDREPAEYEEALTIIRDAGRRLRRLVDDLFLLARADAGELPLRCAPLYLDELVADGVREVRSIAQAKGIALKVDADREAPFTGDDSLLHRLLMNVLDNAIKYSPRGTSITVRLARCDSEYHLEVEDTGPGIPEAVRPRIFDRFVRADAARAREGADTGGAGLGLSIARWIAEAHGGQLALARSSEAGSIFRLTLPAAGC